MRRLALLLFLSARLGADCIGNGHYTLNTSRFPYTEDLSVTRPQTISFDEQMRWTQIQGGCETFAGQNIRAREPVNVLLRASFNISGASGNARFEVQLRVDDAVVASAIRTLHGRYPYSERFGGIVRNLDAGAHTYSMWLRLLDGPPSNAMTIGLQWITAQGVPANLPVQETAMREEVVTTEWRPLGDELPVESADPIDLSMLATYDATGDGELMFGWSVDGESAGPHVIITASHAATLFDHAAGIAAGRHTLRLYARNTTGTMVLHEVQLAALAFPGDIVQPMASAIATDSVDVTADGDDVQPASMSSICGRWTKILDVTLEPSDGNPSWALEGFIEITGWTGEGTWAVLGIDAEHFERGHDAVTDMGIFQFQLGPQHDGISFYGDCSKWGNYDQPARLSLWMRRVAYCGDAPPGGAVTVGRRWLSVKLLPSLTPHLR